MSASTPIVVDHDHHAALLAAEGRRRAHTLSSYGVLTRRQLAELSGAHHWPRGRFLRALEDAEERGLVRHLGFDFYAPASLASHVRSRNTRIRRFEPPATHAQHDV